MSASLPGTAGRGAILGPAGPMAGAVATPGTTTTVPPAWPAGPVGAVWSPVVDGLGVPPGSTGAGLTTDGCVMPLDPGGATDTWAHTTGIPGAAWAHAASMHDSRKRESIAKTAGSST
ncbi:MAG TPA: hypothetical protein VEQ63_10105 [Bryobacteraceae bacterium]|nr:hypothetical protein [Bryobacteraceae bacterium]